MAEWINVGVDDHSFYILDQGEIPIETADWSNGLVVTMSADAVIYTGIHTGYVRVRAVPHTRPPQEETAAPSSPWEEIIETSVHAPYGELRVDTQETGPVTDIPLLSPQGPGWYRVRVHARGRDTDYDGVRRDPIEDYLLLI
jgi:hypothetical protein